MIAELPGGARKELFSIAYVSAIAAAAQVEFMRPAMDYSSIDGYLLATAGTCPQIGIQLKATAQDCITEGMLVFDLPIKNYEDLRAPRAVPSMLIVLHLPSIENDWISHGADMISLRNSAYYLSLAGLPETENVSVVRVRIPLTQRLTKESLLSLLQHVADHKRLP